MLLNKINVLDKGFVALISSSNDGKRLGEIKDDLFKAQLSKKHISLASATMHFKCPIFIQLNLSVQGFNIVGVPLDGPVEAWVPDSTWIGSPDRKTDDLISKDMERTTSALLINPEAYQHDGCDRFVSQVMTPINVYTELVVSGSLQQWINYIDQQGLPQPLAVYMDAVKQILDAEWKNLDELKRL